MKHFETFPVMKKFKVDRCSLRALALRFAVSVFAEADFMNDAGAGRGHGDGREGGREGESAAPIVAVGSGGGGGCSAPAGGAGGSSARNGGFPISLPASLPPGAASRKEGGLLPEARRGQSPAGERSRGLRGARTGAGREGGRERGAAAAPAGPAAGAAAMFPFL